MAEHSTADQRGHRFEPGTIFRKNRASYTLIWQDKVALFSLTQKTLILELVLYVIQNGK